MVPNQSRPASPFGGRISPFRGKGFKVDSSKRFSRPVSCPESPRNALDVETISSQDDCRIQMKPSVHFNIIPPIPRKRTAIKVIETTIDDIENRELIANVSYHDRDMESFELPANGQIRSANLNRCNSTQGVKPLPAPRHHIQRSAGSLSRIDTDEELLSQPILNPRSYHKGLLCVVGGSNNFLPSKIPRRKSSVSSPNIRNSNISPTRRNSRISSSTDRLSMRRDSSVSPRRKIGNEFGGSMIDLGMTPTVLTLSRPINRISRPTALSPIVGTPNKDSEQDPSHFGSDGRKCGSDSPTKIPVRRSSSVNINGISRAGSKANSRESSPMKLSDLKSPTKIPQKVNKKNGSPKKVAKKPVETSKCTKPATPNTVNKELLSTKKEPSINREKSSVKKPLPATIKREPSTLKRQPSNLKRQNSQQKLKRENSKVDLGGLKAAVKLNARRDPSSTTLLKNQSDSSLVKRLEKTNSFKQKRRTSSESDGLNEIDTANLSDKLMPLTKTNGLSMTTAAITSQPVQITTAVTDHLSKKNSSGQIVINENSNTNSDNNNNSISSSNVSDPNVSTKAETTTKTTPVSDINSTMATGTAASATPVSAATLPPETIGKLDVSSEKKPEIAKIESDKNGNDKAKINGLPPVLEKNPSTRTIGGKSEALGTPIVPESIERELIGTPIETKVNVIDNTLINIGNSEALQSNPNDIAKQEHSKSDGTGKAEWMANENRSKESLDKDNGISSHNQPSDGFKTHT